jgi:hypothetical protein
MTLAEALRLESAALTRRLIHYTRSKGPLNMQEARELAERMALTMVNNSA